MPSLSLTAMLRPGIDWIKRTVIAIAFRELSVEASAAAGCTIEPPALDGVTYPQLPALAGPTVSASPSSKGRGKSS